MLLRRKQIVGLVAVALYVGLMSQSDTRLPIPRAAKSNKECREIVT